jgi:uncharacterized protein YdeI (BOF family)
MAFNYISDFLAFGQPHTLLKGVVIKVNDENFVFMDYSATIRISFGSEFFWGHQSITKGRFLKIICPFSDNDDNITLEYDSIVIPCRQFHIDGY